jgi:2-(1,2-epoxy-1,2-dihydrophenyl)acetyl-CoA isomerase
MRRHAGREPMSELDDAATATPPLAVRRDGALVWLRLNRPQRLNAIDVEMARALGQALREVERDASVRAVLLEGEGRAFCAGGDLAHLRQDRLANAAELIEAFHDALRVLDALRVPVLASLQGMVAGAGVSLALACDLAIATDDTRFNLAYVNIGASCDGSSSWSLPRVVGLRKAMEIALLGETFDAAEALRLGIVNRVVRAVALPLEAERMARRLAEGPTLALGAMKRLLRDSLDRPLAGQLDAEQAAFLRCATTHDFAAGLDAFAAKGAPRFEGR